MRNRVDQNGVLWDFQCECSFTSKGWPSQVEAETRGDQHTAEHETQVPMPELADFAIEGEVIT